MKCSKHKHLRETISNLMAIALKADDPDHDLAIIDLSEYGIIICANTKRSRIPWDIIGKKLSGEE